MMRFLEFNKRFLFLTLLLSVDALLVGSHALRADDTDHAQMVFFENKVRPLLAERCLKCHDQDKQKGDLQLDSLSGMLTGGSSGPALVPGNPADSLLIQAVKYQGLEMPPDSRLSDAEIEILEQWVATGAKWPNSSAMTSRAGRPNKISDEDRKWWAFQPLSQPAIPTTKSLDDSDLQAIWSRQEIDQFILAKMQSKGLTPAPPADRVSLMRRLSFDLTGLPPTPQETERFLNDSSSNAYESLVDRLLSSPHYGERWARHWLDLVRYADSDGYRIDHYRPDAWRYRDYVINSFNQDKPYDRFVQEQIAGDEMFPEDPQAAVATGFLRHWIYEYNSRDARTQWSTILNDITDTTGDVFLGLGFQCAKCHDHKFDPILQKDYYRLQAFFAPMIPTDRVIASPEEIKKYQQQLKQWEEATEKIRSEIAAIEKPYREKAAEEAIARFPPDVESYARKSPSERNCLEQQLAYLVYRQVDFEYDRLDDKIKGEEKEKRLALRKELNKFQDLKPKPLPTALTVKDIAGVPAETTIPKRSDNPIAPGYLTLLDPTDAAIEALPQGDSSGRRTSLARWLTRPDHPLTTRVIVNRLWQHHFGKGLTPNASDFGHLGGSPNYPELLDWLTGQFIRDGWSLKKLHRRIVLSETYRQSTQHPEWEQLQKLDPLNQFHWRADTRRLDAEQIRDAILSSSGLLQHAPIAAIKTDGSTSSGTPESESDQQTVSVLGGEGVQPDVPRRSIYLRVMRNARDPLLDAFDLPLFFSSESSRNTTTTPVQSLMLINSPLMLSYATALTERVFRDAPTSSLKDRINQLWLNSYLRLPSEEELAQATAFVTSQSRIIKENQEQQNQVELAQSKLPFRDGLAVAIAPDQPQARLMIQHDARLNTGNFTLEAFFQVRSIYESGEVRTIASKGHGGGGKTGWGFGVTGKGSRRKPQTLVMQMWGKKRDGSIGEAAIFSDQNINLNIPYFVGAAVELASDSKPGTVTFYLKDLSNDDDPLQIAKIEHDIVGGLENTEPVTLGGRSMNESGLFDGLLDDVRISHGALKDNEILYASENITESTRGFWRFESQPGVLADSSGSGLQITPAKKSTPISDPDFSAFRDLSHAILNSNEFLYVD
jgi:hypothetical protein